jgi:hypothetical protein
MPDPVKHNGKHRYCTGLKAIAVYLGDRLGCTVTTRTVHRWVRERGLPVKKLSGWTIACTKDIDEWLER